MDCPKEKPVREKEKQERGSREDATSGKVST